MKVYRSIDLGAAELSEKISEASDISINFEPLSEEELVASDYDLIELSEEQSLDIIARMPMLDWPTQSTRAADAFTKDKNGFKPLHLGAMAFVNFLQSKKINLDTSKNAVLVGGYSFLMTFGLALAKLGFNKIYLISPAHISYEDKIADLKKSLFGVHIQQLTLDDISNISELASLLVIDFAQNEFPEIVETLTYFNFVTENALFLDLQSYLNNTLSAEAERASLRVLDSVEFQLHKYRFFQKNQNIRS